MGSRNPQLPLPFCHNTLLLHAGQRREAVKALQVHSVQGVQVIFEIGIAARSDKQPDIPAIHLLPRISGPFDQLVYQLHHDPLLRVHHRRFILGDAEQSGVKAIRVIKEPAIAAVGFAKFRSGTVIIVDIPAVPRHFTDRILPLQQVVPEFLRT
ncbi:hypothetical protein D3C75_259580 [compost metagenome]